MSRPFVPAAEETVHHWLAKTEPDTFSWQDLVRDGKTRWDGVRNYAARNHLRAMAEGDLVLIYHSGEGKEIVGIARVIRTAYRDPTAGDDDRWSAVDMAPVVPVHKPVSLQQIKAEAVPGGALQDIRMIRENRLSVVPLTDAEWQRLLTLAETPDPGTAP